MFTSERFDIGLSGLDSSNLPETLPCTAPGSWNASATLIREHFERLSHFFGNLPDGAAVTLNEKSVATPWFTSLFKTLAEAENELQRDRGQKIEAENWGIGPLVSISRYLPETAWQLNERLHWFQIGFFEKPGIWRVDKSQIKAILWQESVDKFLFLCPSFDFTRAEQIVDRLPDVIDASANPNWSLLEQMNAEGTRVRRKAVGVIHKITRNGTPQGARRASEAAQTEERKRFIPDTKFNDIGGIDPVLGTIREVIELPLKRPEVFTRLGIKPHRGILLYGPPGCGKTMIAKAIANEIQAHFIPVKGPEILEKYYGASEENLRALFEEAREMQPSVIFFDEMDALAGRRTGLDVLRMDDRLVNQLLALMDGIEAFGNVCVIGATNRPELIDAALTRPGRFDYLLEIPRPDERGIRQILDIATRNMPLDGGFHLEDWAGRLAGRSGADITFLAREAAYSCIRRNLAGGSREGDWTALDPEHMTIETVDFEQAFSRLTPLVKDRF